MLNALNRDLNEKTKAIRSRGYIPAVIYGNKLDNRSYNLISCTIRENNINASIRSNNSSGVIGVYFNTLRSRWVAQINDSENHIKNLGSFINKEDAICVRLEAEAKYYGESAPQRHLFEQYKINIGGGTND